MLNKTFLTIIMAALPTLASAQLAETTKILDKIYGIVDKLIPLVFGLAVLLFFWGVTKYIWGAGSGKDEGKKIMFWGVIAIFVMSSIWGIVYWLGQEIGGGIGDEYDMKIPTIKK